MPVREPSESPERMQAVRDAVSEATKAATEAVAQEAAAIADFMASSICGECETELGFMECLQCHELYCAACFDAVHNKGRRKKHSDFVRHRVCASCEASIAEVHCMQCRESYCERCSVDIHASKGPRKEKRHRIDPISVEELRVVSHDTKNSYGMLTKLLTFRRFDPMPQAMAAALTDCDTTAAELREEGKQFVSECAFQPENPDVQYLIAVGTADETVKQLHDDTATTANATEDWRESFNPVMDSVFCWRRTQAISPQPFVFCDAPNALHLQLPPKLDHPGYISFVPTIERGVIEDHHFMLAVSAVMASRAVLSNLFVSTEYADVGMYTFQFYDDKTRRWAPVTIDSFLPCRQDLHVAIGRTSMPNEYWLALLAKAYATFRGSYAHLHHGSAPLALRHFTAGEVDMMSWNDLLLSEEAKTVLWWRLNQMTKWGMFAVCATAATSKKLSFLKRDHDASLQDEAEGNVDPVETDEIVDRFNMVDDGPDAFDWSGGDVILMAQELPRPKTMGTANNSRRSSKATFADMFLPRLVKLRSVYSDSAERYTGPWSDFSDLWTKEARAELAHHNLDDRITWMPIDQFAKKYDTVCIVRNDLTAERLSFFSTIPEIRSSAVIATRSPHFLLVVESKMPGEAEEEEKFEFNTITELEVPPFDAGSETEDEGRDGVEDGVSSVMSSALSSTLTSAMITTAVGFEITVSRPPTKSTVDYEVMLFRVQNPEKQKYVESIVDGEASYAFPVHSRIPLKDHVAKETRDASPTASASSSPLMAPLDMPTSPASPAQANPESNEGTAMTFKGSVSAGYYNVVVVPVKSEIDNDAVEVKKPCTTDTKGHFTLVFEGKRNADLYNCRMSPLP